MNARQKKLNIFGDEFYCRRCGHKLKDEESRILGVGPECMEKIHEAMVPKRIRKIIDGYIKRENNV
jgi:hypothetical protein